MCELIKDIQWLHKHHLDTLPDSAWYTPSGIRAAKAGANDAYQQSRQ